MNSTDRINLKAFLIALAQHSSPLPDELQTELKIIGQDIEKHLGRLNYLGNTYLTTAYQDAGDLLYSSAAERNKGGFVEINEAEERRNNEIQNEIELCEPKKTETPDPSSPTHDNLGADSKRPNVIDIVKNWTDNKLKEVSTIAFQSDHPSEKTQEFIGVDGYPFL
jgi:hypothetical protein